jgi:hypothetical protein
VTLIHLLSAASGTASPTIRKVLDEVIEKAISAGSRMKIVYASVDGDEGYTSHFNECFSQLKSSIQCAGCDERKLIETVTSVHPFWINDWLHLLKNARTRLFRSQICVSPLIQSPGASMTGSRQYFEKVMTSLMLSLSERCEMPTH